MDEKQILELNYSQTSQKASLKEQFTTVTPVSKYLSMTLFIALPFIGFWMGGLGIEKVYVEVPMYGDGQDVVSLDGVSNEVTNSINAKNTDLILRDLGGNYLTDDMNIYQRTWPNHFQYQLITEDKFDVGTFKVLGLCWGSGNAVRVYFVKDKNHVYCGSEIVEEADPETFQILNDYIGDNIHDEGIAYLAKDKTTVFAASFPLAIGKSAEFKHFGDKYVMSANKIYYWYPGAQLVEVTGADIGTFRVAVLPEFIDAWEYGDMARDKNFVYKQGVVYTGNVPKELFPVPVEEFATTSKAVSQLIPFDGPIDTSSVYQIGRNSNTSFEPTEFISPQGKHYKITDNISKILSENRLTSNPILLPGTSNTLLLTQLEDGGGTGATCKFENKIFTYDLDTEKLTLIFYENQENIQPTEFQWCKKAWIAGTSGTKVIFHYIDFDSGGGPCSGDYNIFLDASNIGLLDFSDITQGMSGISVSEARKADAQDQLWECQNSPGI